MKIYPPFPLVLAVVSFVGHPLSHGQTSGSFTFSLSAFQLRDAQANPIAIQAPFILVADTGRDGKVDVAAGTDFTTATWVDGDSGDDLILANSTIDPALAGDGGILALINIDFNAATMTVGDPVYLIWFPALGSETTIPADEPYGIFGGPNAGTPQMLWEIPGVGSTISLEAVDSANGGDVSIADLTANRVVTANATSLEAATTAIANALADFPESERGLYADADRDGIANILEWMLLRDPATISTGASLQFTGDTLDIEVRDTDSTLRFLLRTSIDLSTWTTTQLDAIPADQPITLADTATIRKIRLQPTDLWTVTVEALSSTERIFVQLAVDVGD